MGRIIVIMGKSASGKDTMYRELMRDESLGLRKIVLYTTRPLRSGEKTGREYHFVTDNDIRRLEEEGRLVEKRVYHTMHGDWTYATVDSPELHDPEQSYLVIGTPVSYAAMCEYYGAERVMPVYLTVDDGVRLERALARERALTQPRYAEMCRRYLADEEDFAPEKLREAGICEFYDNSELESCISAVKAAIRSM